MYCRYLLDFEQFTMCIYYIYYNKYGMHIMSFRYTFEILQESAQYLLDRIKIRPKIGIICGSGMG